MSRPVLGIAVAVLLTVVLIQTVVLWRTAEPPAAGERADKETIADRLGQFGAVDNLTFDPATGMYRANVGGQMVYATPDGRHLLAGEIYDLETQENLTEIARTEIRRETLGQLDADTAITFEPEGDPEAVVWVFTDVSCAYCRRFHQHISEYTARGIEVRYLAFPRAGPHSETWKLTESVWCADDRRAALTAAKADRPVSASGTCESETVADHYGVGRDMGLRGTPMILAADGRELGGYLSPSELASRLDVGG